MTTENTDIFRRVTLPDKPLKNHPCGIRIATLHGYILIKVKEEEGPTHRQARQPARNPAQRKGMRDRLAPWWYRGWETNICGGLTDWLRGLGRADRLAPWWSGGGGRRCNTNNVSRVQSLGRADRLASWWSRGWETV